MKCVSCRPGYPPSPVQGTRISWTAKGQLRLGAAGRGRMPDEGVRPGRALLAQMKAVTGAWPETTADWSGTASGCMLLVSLARGKASRRASRPLPGAAGSIGGTHTLARCTVPWSLGPPARACDPKTERIVQPIRGNFNSLAAKSRRICRQPGSLCGNWRESCRSGCRIVCPPNA